MPRDWSRSAPRYSPDRRSCGHKFHLHSCPVCQQALAEVRAERAKNQKRLRERGSP